MENRERKKKDKDIFERGQAGQDRDPGKPTREPGRTPGTAEGGEGTEQDPGKPTREPGRTPGSAEG